VYNNTSAVGCFAFGMTPEDGLRDLAGNVWEWTRSTYQDYPYDPTDGREDTENPESRIFVLRGGGWGNQSDALRASSRLYFVPVFRFNFVGCRVVRCLPEA